MAIHFKVTPKRPGGIAGERAPRYYPTLTGRSIADLNMICDRISERSSLHRADVKAVVESLIEIITELIQKGYNPRLDEFGTFSVHVSSKGKDHPEQVTSRDIESTKMAFLPSKRMKNLLKLIKFTKVTG
ncbi:MAG: HU family DNA-binding protein [Cyclobacteriaceae bacterium]